MPVGHKLHHGLGDVFEQGGVGLEEILVEVLRAARAGAEQEVARDVGRVVDALGQRDVVGHVSSSPGR